MAASIMACYLLLITLATSHHLVMPQAGLLKKPLYGLLYCFYQQRVWLSATALFIGASSSLALHKLKDMIAYSRARRGLAGMPIWLAYPALGLLLLCSGRYAPWQQLLLAIAFLGVPYLFTHQDIQNPTRRTKMNQLTEHPPIRKGWTIPTPQCSRAGRMHCRRTWIRENQVSDRTSALSHDRTGLCRTAL